MFPVQNKAYTQGKGGNAGGGGREGGRETSAREPRRDGGRKERVERGTCMEAGVDGKEDQGLREEHGGTRRGSRKRASGVTEHFPCSQRVADKSIWVRSDSNRAWV
eukprot:24838-Hanusia_phi.AAC.2